MFDNSISRDLDHDPIEPIREVADSVNVYCSPCAPTQLEIDKHNAANHIPFRSWCPVCVAARGKESPHKRTLESSHNFPIFSCDYGFLGSQDAEHKIIIFVIKESKSGSIWVTMVPRKGVSETEVAIEFMLSCIAELLQVS